MADIATTNALEVISEFNIVSGVKNDRVWKGFQFVTKGGYKKIFFVSDEAVYIVKQELEAEPKDNKTILDD